MNVVQASIKINYYRQFVNVLNFLRRWGGGSDTTPPDSTIDQAIQSGDASALTDPIALAVRAKDQIQTLDQQQTTLASDLYQGVSSEYQPTRQSQFVLPANSELAQPFIVGDTGKLLASVSIANSGRSAGYGVNVLDQFRNDANLTHAPALKRLLSWLLSGDASKALPATFNIAWSGLNSTNGMSGLSKAGVTAVKLTCDPIADTSCGQQADLIIVGSGVAAADTLEAQIRAYVAAGKPVLYLHTNAWGDSTSGRQMLAGMGMLLGPYAGNYFAQDAVGAGRNSNTNATKLDQFAAIKPLLNRIASNNFRTDYDWNACPSSCIDLPALKADLIDPSEIIRSQLDEFNRNGTNLFNTPNTTLLSLLVLWADTTRKSIVYPLDKVKQPADFQRALLADAWVAYVRDTGVAQANLGTFLGATAAAEQVSTTNETVLVSLPSNSGFTAIGRFAQPGQTMSVEVLDAGGATLALRINTQRTGSTRLWEADLFNRPRYLASPAITLEQGTPISINTPYGGTLQLSFSGTTAGQLVQLRLRGVAHQPFLDLTQAGDKAAFVTAMNTSQMEWAEIKMSGIEIHSRIDKIKSVLSSEYGNDMARYLDEMQTVFFEDAYQFAGFNIPGKTLPSSILDKCTTLQWDCTNATLHHMPGTQHINVDTYAQCGSGCSGNPYDQTWGLSPRGWGESHEVGHNLQPALFKIYDDRSSEVSNNLFPLHKDWRLLRDFGDDRNTTRVAYQSAFNMIKAAKAEADPIEGAYQRIWGNAAYAVQNGERMAFYMQWVHYWAERTGSDEQGWDIITLLYLHQRQFANLDWATNKDKLGYSQYATKPSVDGNDNLLITLSWLTQRDQRATFDLWGVRYSTTAAAQVTSYGFAAETALFYANNNTNNHASLVKVNMNATTPVWPF